MRYEQRVVLPAYALAMIMILFPVIDFALQVWPPVLQQSSWRFGAIGIVSRLLITPFLGLFLILVIAAWREHLRVLQAFTLLNALLVLGFLALLVVFALDGLEVRALVTPETADRFDLTALVGLFKLTLAPGLALLYALGGWKIARSLSRSARADTGPGIVRAGVLGGAGGSD
jgi:hypothetical protein